MITCCQITCTIPWSSYKQLPYPPEHPRILRIRQGDNAKIPLLTLSYKCLLPQHSFSILPSFMPKLISLVAALVKSSRTRAARIFPRISKSPALSPSREKWPSTSSCLRVIHPHLFIAILYPSANLLTLLSLPLFFQSLNIRSWARKLLFPPNNLTSNASVHWVTQILPIWLMQRPTEFLLGLKISLYICGRIPSDPGQTPLKDWFLRVSKNKWSILGWAQDRSVHQIVHCQYG